MLTIQDFAAQYPQYRFNFDAPMRDQLRVYDKTLLEPLSLELAPETKYTQGGRGRPNRNQTKTHHQCGSCHRVLRNDQFWNPPSAVRQNIVPTHCIECATAMNDARYTANGERLRLARLVIWRYIAPSCIVCGYNRHPAAMDMHHTGEKEELLSQLIARFAASPLERNALKLIDEANRCVPLCSNCHRLLHAGELQLPSGAYSVNYDLVELMRLTRDALQAESVWQPRLLRESPAID